MKTTIVIIIIIVLVIFGVFWWNSSQKVQAPTTASTSQNQGTQTSEQTQTTTTQTTTFTAPSASSQSITISNFTFNPSPLTVKAGTTVTWTNNDSVSHTVTGDNGGPASGPLANGDTYSYTFNTAGTFAYHCSVHPSMHGTVIVTN